MNRTMNCSWFKPIRGSLIVGMLVPCLIGILFTGCTREADNVVAIVKGYLNSIARGDAQSALSLGSQDYTACPLLTNNVLSPSIAKAPLTVDDVELPVLFHDSATHAKKATVMAHYHLGTEAVAYAFTLTSTSAGWKMDKTYTKVQSPLGAGLRYDLGDGKSVSLTLNGSPISDPFSKMCLFPGVYDLASSNHMISVSGGRLTVTTLASESFTQAESTIVSVNLSTTAQKQIGTLAQATLDNCLTQHSLHTTCGVGEGRWHFDEDVIESTIVWSLEPKGMDMSRWEWRLFYGTAIPTGSQFQEDYLNYSLFMRGTAPDGKPFSMSYYPPAVCANISDPSNLRFEFGDDSSEPFPCA